MNSDEKISALYQKIEKKLPSEMVDARVKKLARDKVGTNNKSVIKSWSNLRWLSSAAVIVLSVGVILKIVQQEPVSKNLSDEIIQQSLIKPMPAKTVKDDASMQDSLLERDFAPRVINEEEVFLESEPLEKKETRQLFEKHKSKLSIRRDEVVKKRFQAKPKAAELPMAPAMMSSEPLMDGATMLEQGKDDLMTNWCGQKDLIDELDKVVWQERIKQLQEANQLELLKCLQEKFLEVFEL